MITLDVTTDNKSGIAGMVSGLNDQLPYAYALATNDTVNQSQAAVQTALHREFTLRRESFIVDTIYRKPGQDFATKQHLAGTVRVNPERNFLAKFEDGGEKQSIAGKALAIPVFRQDTPNLIIRRGDPLSVKMLMAVIQQHQGKVLHFRDLKRKGQVKVTVDPNRVYLVKSGKGTFILQRTGPGKSGSRVLYWFRNEVPIPADLHFEETAMATAVARFEPNFTRAIEYAIATMR